MTTFMKLSIVDSPFSCSFTQEDVQAACAEFGGAHEVVVMQNEAIVVMNAAGAEEVKRRLHGTRLGSLGTLTVEPFGGNPTRGAEVHACIPLLDHNAARLVVHLLCSHRPRSRNRRRLRT
eukprot:GDKH01020099.1.p1 GENE.GDKH01020099.1~~GDKH01020099.1.p1  ORF type:complete len:120 (-),score=7.12 GDKH01020099.1:91-450(-)